MTKKYEKFEEWMIGRKVRVDGFEGVVLERYWSTIVPSDIACIKFKTGDNPGEWLWSELEDVTFLEESPPIPWEVGQVVWDVVFGKGVVRRVEEGAILPVKVEFDDGDNESYTLQGCFYEVGTRTLFFSEPTIIADTMPPKKPFTPILKEGDAVIVCRPCGTIELHTVLKETEYVLHTEDLDLEKSKIKVFKLGEEIKWEN